MTLARGWKARRAASDARREDRAAAWADDRAEVRLQRAALAEKARVEAEAVAAAQEAAIRQTVTRCPCCHGQGHLLVPDAATIIEAVDRYKATGWRPSPATVAQLLKDSFIVDHHGERVDPVQAVEPVVEATAEPTKAVKPARRPVVALPFLASDD